MRFVYILDKVDFHNYLIGMIVVLPIIIILGFWVLPKICDFIRKKQHEKYLKDIEKKGW